MTPFRFQTAQKNSASLRSSVRQFESLMTSYRALLLNTARRLIFNCLLKNKAKGYCLMLCYTGVLFLSHPIEVRTTTNL